MIPSSIKTAAYMAITLAALRRILRRILPNVNIPCGVWVITRDAKRAQTLIVVKDLTTARLIADAMRCSMPNLCFIAGPVADSAMARARQVLRSCHYVADLDAVNRLFSEGKIAEDDRSKILYYLSRGLPDNLKPKNSLLISTRPVKCSKCDSVILQFTGRCTKCNTEHPFPEGECAPSEHVWECPTCKTKYMAVVTVAKCPKCQTGIANVMLKDI